MPTQNLFGSIALNALGAPVPAGDVAFKIEHKDRIILDTFYKKAKSLLALSQLFRSSFALDACTLTRRESAQTFIEDGEAPECGLLRQQAQPDDRITPPVLTQ